MALSTARDMVKKSLKLIGVGAEGETPSAEMMNDGLDSLNLMLSLWGARNLMTLAEIQENFPLVAAQASYTMGVSSVALPTDFDTIKPHKINSAFVRDSTGNDYSVQIITTGQYNDLTVKTTPGRPDRLYQDPGETQQTAQRTTLIFYPVPDVIYTIYMFSEKPLTLIADLDTNITMEDVYKAAIIFNLSPLLATEYGLSTPGEVLRFADQTMSAIEKINASQTKEIADLWLPVPERSNIMTGR